MANKAHGKITAPSDWVLRFSPLITGGGQVLDLACGAGRHGRFLLERGFAVTFLDIDTSKVRDLKGHPNVTIMEYDLEAEGAVWPFGEWAFDGIVVTNYLHRLLFPEIIKSLRPMGVLIYETFAEGNEAFGKPANPDHLLRAGELLDAFGELLHVVAYEHGYRETPRESIIQRLCAVNLPRAAGASANFPLGK